MNYNTLLQKIDLCFLNCKLLENNDFTEDEYAEMIDLTSQICDNLLYGIKIEEKYNKLIFVTLVEIAKRWKETDKEEISDENNSSFWCYVFKMLLGVNENNQSLYTKLTNLILEMGQQKQIAVVKDGKKYYATLMMHAFSPKNSIFSFFNLCYNVYKKDLDYAYTNDDEWICEIVALQIKDLLQNGYSEDKAVSIGSNAYNIKIGLRSFALHEDLSDDFIEFIRSVFESINKLFNGDFIKKDTRLGQNIDDWWKNKMDNEEILDKIIHKSVLGTVVKQNIVAKYIKKDDNVILCIPSIRLNSDKDFLFLIVYVNGIEKYNRVLLTKRGEFIISTKEMEFDLNELLEDSDSIKIQVEVSDFYSVLYDSKETLNREFILFKDEKEVFSQINKPSNYFVYSRNIDELIKIPKELSTCGKNVYNIYTTAGESLTGKVKQVIFDDNAQSARTSNTIYLLGNLTNVEWILDDIHCIVYKDSVKLIIPENINLRTLELRIDTKIYKLDTLNFERLDNNAYMFGLLKLGLLNKQKPIELSLYSYEKEKTILKQTLIVLPDIVVNYNNPIFYGDIEKKITICNNNDKKNVFSWSNHDNEIVCPLLDGNLIVKIPYLRWRIANKEWHNEPISGKIWYKDFLENGDLLEFDNTDEDVAIKLFVKIGEQDIGVHKNISGKYEIGRIIYANDNKTDISLYVSRGDNTFKLFTTATKEHFTENPIVYRNGKVYWNVEESFVGDQDNKFFLAIESEKNNYGSRIENKNCEILNLYEDVCKITVSIQNKNFFINNENYKIIFEHESFIIGNPKKFRFKNKCLKIEYIKSLYSIDETWKKTTKDYGIYNLNFVEEKEGDETYEYYEGTLGIISNDVIEEIKFMENENNEKERINPIRIELKSSNTFWLYAGYDNNGDFENESLMVDGKKELCFCNIPENKVVNLYKFRELKIIEHV